MSQETDQSPCASVEHQGHLCELEGQQEWDILRAVTDHPKFRCEGCCGVANSARNVCQPEEL
jgi:hypothetical protein